MVSLCAGTSKSAETQGSSQRKDAETREWAVVCAASTFDFGTGEIDPHKAAILFRSRHGGGVHKRVKERHSVFIERHYKNFREFGCIADAHRSGRPVIISEEDALAASNILKAGHWVTEKIKGLPGATYEELIYFSTMDEALLKSPQLQAIQQKYGVSPSKLLKRMHAVDPDLIRITLRSHHKFSYAELQDRIRWCLTMLARVAADPSMMYHIVFCDESTFVLHGLSKHSVQVYCSAGAARPSDVCFISDKTIKPIKVHFFLAVTAHGQYEDANGVVLYEECSGTTDIDRRANKLQDGSEMTGKQEYWVSDCMLFVIQKQMLPCQLS